MCLVLRAKYPESTRNQKKTGSKQVLFADFYYETMKSLKILFTNRGRELGLGPILSPLEVQVKSVRCICFNLLKHCQKSWMPHVLPAQHVLHPLHSWRRWHCCFTPDAAVCHIWKISNPPVKSCCGRGQEVSNCTNLYEAQLKSHLDAQDTIQLAELLHHYTHYWFLLFSVQECRKKSPLESA